MMKTTLLGDNQRTPVSRLNFSFVFIEKTHLRHMRKDTAIKRLQLNVIGVRYLWPFR